MRQADTYRSARRNLVREQRNSETKKLSLRYGRLMDLAAQANHRADLAGRRKLCAAASALVIKKVHHLPRPLAVAATMRILLAFWRKAPNTRVNYRIVRDLEKQSLTLPAA
jgi:hypothetical protein